MVSIDEKFLHVLHIWLEKPHVVCQSVFGAVKLVGPELEQVYSRQLLHTSLDVEPLAERVFVSPSDLSAEFFSVNNEEAEEEPYYRIGVTKSSQESACEYRISVTTCREATGHERRFFTPEWLRTCLQAKLNHWLSQCNTAADLIKTPSSLSCVDLADYQQIYYRMKSVYGPQLVANWTERTNAEKFVYEDVGIAAYWMCLWKGDTGVRFVDVGCGNGLLVYLLNSEGHNGIGYDIRKRRIWHSYPDSIRLALIEQTIVPTNPDLAFPNADWLLGNHSDELTPWLPVLASRSGCRGLFLLPCCPYNFDGSRYDRRGGGGVGDFGGTSKYRDYLAYIRDLCGRVGYRNVRRDCLRIPSTKRVCFVATQLDSSAASLSELSELAAGSLSSSFRPRLVESELAPRNCARVPIDTRKRVELALFRALLGDDSGLSNRNKDCPDRDKDYEIGHLTDDKDQEPKNLADNKDHEATSLGDNKDHEATSLGDNKDHEAESFADNKDHKTKYLNCDKNGTDKDSSHIGTKTLATEALKPSATTPTKTWNAGRSLPLSQLISLLSDADRAALKNECGGLQTLLRNCHQAFQVQAGLASIRRPLSTKSASTMTIKQQQRRKTKPCWMDQYHPDGCCLPADECAFRHACEASVE